jgi:hypothetical protein
MKTKFVRSMALFGVLSVAACGDDDPTSTGDQLSEAEAAALSGLILESAFATTASGVAFTPALSDGPQAAPFSYATEVSATVPCSLGGSVSITGNANVSGDDQTGEFLANFNLSQSYSDCAEVADDIRFTLGGALNVTAETDFTIAGNTDSSFTINTVLSGSVNWRTDDDRSGTCVISLTSEATADGQSVTSTTTGQACGVSVNETSTFSVDG